MLYNYAEPLTKFLIQYDTCILQRQLVRETVCLVLDGVKNQIETGECTSENNYNIWWHYVVFLNNGHNQ